MKIHRRQEDGSYEVVASVFADGTVEGDSPTAEDIDSMLSGEGVYVPGYADDREDCYLTEGMDMLLYLETRLSNGYFQAALEEQDWDDMAEYNEGRDILGKQDNQGPPEDSDAPSDCRTEYLDDPSEAPEGAQVYEGVQEDTHFYCTNYLDIGALSDDFEDDMADRIEDINERLPSPHELEDNEFITDKEVEKATEGEHVIMQVDGEEDDLQRALINAHMTLTQGGDVVMVVDPEDDSQGAFIDYSEWDEVVEGVVVEGVEGEEGGQWDDYERPRDIYSPEYVESKENIRDFLGEPQGVNSMYTYVATFDNGERAIYKPDSGNAYEESVRTDVAWYEFAQEFSENPDYAPETAAADLKNGLGSAQKWLSGADTWQTLSEEISSTDREEIVKDNKEDIAEISVLDYIWGNDDRHANNMMIRDGQIYAIDNGGFNGPGISPSEHNLADALNLLREFKDPDEREQAFEDVINRQKEILDNVAENKEEIINMTRMVYGEDDWHVKRMRELWDGDDPHMLEYFVEQAMPHVGNDLSIPQEKIQELKEEMR